MIKNRSSTLIFESLKTNDREKQFLTTCHNRNYFVAVLIGCIVGGAVSFGILFAIISALAINEFCNLVNHVEGIQVNKRICILSGIFLSCAFLFWNRSFTNRYIYSLFSFIYLSDGQRTLFEKENPLNNWAYAMLSQMYIALPFALLNVLAFHSDETASLSQYNAILPLSILYSTG